MSKTFIPASENKAYEISGNHGDYELSAGTTVSAKFGSLLSVKEDAYGNRITIDGILHHDSNSAIHDGGNGTRIFVGVDGKVEAGHSGVYFSGDGGTLTNAGTITAEYGVNIGGNGVTVVNSGLLDGNSSGISSGRTATIVNKAGGEIHGDGDGIWLGFSGGQNVVKNFGSITSGEYAIYGSDGSDRIVNRGDISGAVYLNDGDDVFDGRRGSYTATVSGGRDDDTYWLGDKDTVVKEDSGGGFDRMKAGFSYTLADNVEEGSLTGAKNLKLFGTDLGDLLYGNRGANVIRGGGGVDFIDGGRGDDRLFGGGVSADAVADIFVFKAHSGNDKVVDFEDGIDQINLGGYEGFDDFAALKGHVAQSGDDVVITLLNGDSIMIEDTLKSAIKAEDFQF
jgi:serralysin